MNIEASDTLDLETAPSVFSRQSQQDIDRHTIDTGLPEVSIPTTSAMNVRRQSFTMAGAQRIRIMWTTEMNNAVIRFYYTATKLETEMVNYRTEMLNLFNTMFPRFSDRMSESKLMERKRYLLKHNKVSVMEINQIKASVERDLRNNENNNSPSELEMSRVSLVDSQHNNFSIGTILEQVETFATQEEEDLYNDLSYNFNLALTLYNGTDPTTRVILPKLRYSKKLNNIIMLFNERLLPNVLANCRHLENLHTHIFCAAYATCQTLGIQIVTPNEAGETRISSKPQWMRRLENNIKKTRAKLGRITQFKNGNRTTKLIRNLNNDIRPLVIDEMNSQQFTELLHSTTQRLRILAKRLKRYKERKQRSFQNNMFEFNQKKFYLQLKSRNQSNNMEGQCDIQEITEFWSNIWESPKSYNSNATWLHEERSRSMNIQNMDRIGITLEDVVESTRKTHNWKSPGCDGIHNFWYKKLTSIHSKLVELLNEVLIDPSKIPKFMLQGITYLIKKDPNISDVSNHRPITCLPTIYKILTSIISKKVYEHCYENNIITMQQKGIGNNTKGCVDQITFDSIIVGQAKHKNRNLNMAYIDYQKAYDSMSHTYMMDILELYKISENVRQFFKHASQFWNTSLYISNGNLNQKSRNIKICRGIFQGDSFSPLWFCLGMNPLSNILNHTSYGYEVKSDAGSHKISHLFFMDDLKLFASSQEQLRKMLYITETFSSDINMEFNTDKTKMVNLYRGTIMTTSGYVTQNNEIIRDVAENETYKYLGFAQLKGILHSEVKEKIKKMFRKRLNDVLKTQLNAKNKTTALNQYAIPYLTYSFGIVKWSPTDLEELEMSIRKCLRFNRMHDPKSAIERVFLPRELGGRGITNIKNLYCKQMNNLRSYFLNNRNNNDYVKVICSADEGYSALHLKTENYNTNVIERTIEEIVNKWKQKVIHGIFPNQMHQENINMAASNKWLTNGELFGETEGFLISIQDRVVSTKNYRKYILHHNIENEKCRLCNSVSENIDHILNGCSILAPVDYLERHNKVAKIIHQELAARYNFLEEKMPYYNYNPDNIHEDENHLICWDKCIQTDKKILANRPDILHWDKKEKKLYIIDVAVPLNQTIQNAFGEKIRKYTDLQSELKGLWKIEEAYIIPIVISSTGLIPHSLIESLKKIEMEYQMENIQKAVILGTCNIVRKFLNN